MIRTTNWGRKGITGLTLLCCGVVCQIKRHPLPLCTLTHSRTFPTPLPPPLSPHYSGPFPAVDSGPPRVAASYGAIAVAAVH